MEVKQTSYGTMIDIRFNLDPYTARPIMVSDEGISANSNGRKIVKAGSLLDKDGELANDASVRYVLLQDIDVTAGDAAGAGVYRGTLDLAKIITHTGVTPSAAAKGALRGIIFMSDADLDYTGGSLAEPDLTVINGKVTALETAVGDNTKGLVKGLADLADVVGDDQDGLVKDLADLDAIITTETTGLVDVVADHETRIGLLEA